MSLYKQYTQRYQQAYAQGLSAMNPHTADPDLLRLAVTSCVSTARMLEIGCGEGFEAKGLADMGFEVIALDCSPEAISAAQRLNAHPNIQYLVADVIEAEPPHGDQGFDLVYAIGCFHVLTEPVERGRWLGRVYEQLKNTGRLYLRDGVSDKEWSAQDRTMYRLPAVRLPYNIFFEQTKPGVLVENRISIEPCGTSELFELLETCGFVLESSRVVRGGRIFPLERITVAVKRGES
jgi:SAM-dependent methyltransferase